MRVDDSQDADGGDVPEGDADGWDLFGLAGLDGLAGLVGDGRDARYLRGVDYTAAVREAKSGERAVLRSLGRLGCLRARVVTQAWSTERGEPVVRMEIELSPESRLEMELSAEMWRRWVAQAEGHERSIRALAGQSATLRDALCNQRRGASMTTAMRRAWVLCPASLVALMRSGRLEKQDSRTPGMRDAEATPCPGSVDG